MPFPFRRIPLAHSMACILEEYGPCYLDKDYVELGTEEGWLVRTGYILNSEGVIVWTYKLSTGPRSPPVM